MTRIRGFELISEEQFNKDFIDFPNARYEDLKLPKRGTAKSAGYDIYLPIDGFKLEPGESLSIPTGIKSYMLDDEVLVGYPRSGHGFRFFIRFANTNSIIDADFYNNPDNEGHILTRIRNEGDATFTLDKGTAFCQFVFQKYLLVDGDDFTGNERVGGIGSTD